MSIKNFLRRITPLLKIMADGALSIVDLFGIRYRERVEERRAKIHERYASLAASSHVTIPWKDGERKRVDSLLETVSRLASIKPAMISQSTVPEDEAELLTAGLTRH